MDENKLTVKVDISPILATLNVVSVLALASLNENKLNQFIKSLKKINQKKWKKLKINEKLKNYKRIKEEKEEEELLSAINIANSKSTVAEWLEALKLSGNEAKEWLDEYGLLDENISEIDELELHDIEHFISAVSVSDGGNTDCTKIKLAVKRRKRKGKTVTGEGTTSETLKAQKESDKVKEIKNEPTDVS